MLRNNTAISTKKTIQNKYAAVHFLAKDMAFEIAYEHDKLCRIFCLHND